MASFIDGYIFPAPTVIVLPLYALIVADWTNSLGSITGVGSGMGVGVGTGVGVGVGAGVGVPVETGRVGFGIGRFGFTRVTESSRTLLPANLVLIHSK